MLRQILTGTLLAALVAVPAVAVEPPSGDAADRTVEYYYSDATRPVLMDFRVCRDIHEEGGNKHECRSSVDSTALTEGEEIVLWMKFLVPRDASPKILMQVDHKGVTRDTFERTLSGAIRYRTWNRVKLTRNGSWKVRLFHDTEDDVRELYAGSLEVAPATSNDDDGEAGASED